MYHVTVNDVIGEINRISRIIIELEAIDDREHENLISDVIEILDMYSDELGRKKIVN